MSKKSLWTPLTSCFQNCKIEFCRIILQFCRCGGLFDAKGNPDGFLSHFSSLRNFWLGGFSCSLTGCGPPVSVYSIRGPAVNRMFSFDARPSWRVVGEGHAPPLQGVCVCPAVGTNRQCLPEIATVPVGPLREPAGAQNRRRGALPCGGSYSGKSDAGNAGSLCSLGDGSGDSLADTRVKRLRDDIVGAQLLVGDQVG